MTRTARFHPLATALASATLAAACAGAPSHAATDAVMDSPPSSVPAAPAVAPVPPQGETTLQATIPNLKQPRNGLLTGGQPTPAAWQAAAEAGVRTVINLRPQAELAERDVAAEVAAAGLGYRQIAVGGAADVTRENARALWSQLQQAEGDVLVHCASGNRVGALLAIGAAVEGGLDTEAAIEFGRSAGLGSLEPRVREVLAAPVK